MELKEILQQYVDSSYEELVQEVAYSGAKLIARLKELGVTDENALTAVYGYIVTAISADGKVTEKEFQFLQEALNYTREELNAVIELGSDPEFIEAMDSLFDYHDKEVCVQTINIVCCLVAIDETINRDEIAFIEKLLAY